MHCSTFAARGGAAGCHGEAPVTRQQHRGPLPLRALPLNPDDVQTLASKALLVMSKDSSQNETSRAHGCHRRGQHFAVGDLFSGLGGRSNKLRWPQAPSSTCTRFITPSRNTLHWRMSEWLCLARQSTVVIWFTGVPVLSFAPRSFIDRALIQSFVTFLWLFMCR